MGYVKIKEETEDVLYLCREPSPKAWAILVGCTSLGIGAAYYCNDYLVWKLLYIAGAVFVGVSCFETWEECVIDKKEKQVKLKVQNLFQKTFPPASHNFVSADLSELVNVTVSEEDVKYAGKGYIVVLVFESGIKLGVTETATFGDKSDHEAIAQKIYKFTELDKKAELEKEFVDDIEVLETVSDNFPDSTDTDNEKEEIAETINKHQCPIEVTTTVEDTTNIEDPDLPNKHIPVVETIARVTDSTVYTTPVVNVTDVTKEDLTSQGPSSVPQPDQDAGSSSDDSFEKIDESAVQDINENI